MNLLVLRLQTIDKQAVEASELEESLGTAAPTRGGNSRADDWC
ncbi:MAG TPA: hypothetical protein VH500_23410 [Nitrososphaeraceae archaeon]